MTELFLYFSLLAGEMKPKEQQAEKVQQLEKKRDLFFWFR